MFCGCEGYRSTKERPADSKAVVIKGMKIDATNDYGTVTIVANTDTMRTISIEGIDTPHSFVKIPARLRTDRGQSACVIGYRGDIKKLWDSQRGVYISKIDYAEIPIDFNTAEEANDYLKSLYGNWLTLSNERNYKIDFEYTWTDDGLVVRWTIYQPEYWFSVSPYYLSLQVVQIYVDGQKPHGLYKCEKVKGINVEYLAD